jgi:hypothetical protein
MTELFAIADRPRPDMQNEQENGKAMIRKFTIVVGLAALAIVSVGSLASAKMSSMRLGNDNGQAASGNPAKIEGKSQVKPS